MLKSKLFRYVPMLIVSLGMPSTIYWSCTLINTMQFQNFSFWILLMFTAVLIYQRGGFHSLWSTYKALQVSHKVSEEKTLWFFKLWFIMVILHVFNGTFINLFLLNLILTDTLSCLF